MCIRDSANPPIIIGTGPAGLFCGLMLAKAGYRPILLERGGSVEERKEAVETFWKGGKLDPQCNVQFGEGGAGTFSDGKLNTLVKDVSGRNGEVLRIFAEFGADPSICYVNKPHIGTDVLSQVVSRMRNEICLLYTSIHRNFLNNLSEKGVHIIENNVKILEDASLCHVEGSAVGEGAIGQLRPAELIPAEN